MVALKSGAVTLSLMTSDPVAFVWPWTYPPFVPPPAMMHENALGKWFLPLSEVSLGVLPNSVARTMSVLSRRPLTLRSSMSAANAWSRMGSFSSALPKLSLCQSNPPSSTSMKRTPFSTSLRARRQPLANWLGP